MAKYRPYFTNVPLSFHMPVLVYFMVSFSYYLCVCVTLAAMLAGVILYLCASSGWDGPAYPWELGDISFSLSLSSGSFLLWMVAAAADCSY